MAVAIVIEECRAGAPGLAIDASFACHIGEGASAIVAVKQPATKMTDVNVHTTVPIEISTRATHAILAMAADIRVRCHVFKSPVAKVVVKLAAGLVGGVWVERAAVHAKNVQQSVTIEVQQADTAGLHFGHVKSAFMPRTVLKIDTRLSGDLLEPRSGGAGLLSCWFCFRGRTALPRFVTSSQEDHQHKCPT